MTKQTKRSNFKSSKRTITNSFSTENNKVIWVFDNVDKDGIFAFDLNKIGTNCRLIFEKMMEYEAMTWTEINKQTHDKGKSKHHYIDLEKLSPIAINRLNVKHLLDESDHIYSFALQNKLRILGIRKHEKFHVLWYDPEHQICPSAK